MRITKAMFAQIFGSIPSGAPIELMSICSTKMFIREVAVVIVKNLAYSVLPLFVSCARNVQNLFQKKLWVMVIANAMARKISMSQPFAMPVTKIKRLKIPALKKVFSHPIMPYLPILNSIGHL